MNILVTGGAGYIGSVLIERLLERGHKVRCLDRFFFGKETVEHVANNPNFTSIKDDVRWFNPKILEDVDAVIDMASLSNDPTGELDPSKTLDINYLGRRRCAKLAKKYGVQKYVLASSCSVYGFHEGMLSEEAEPNPLTTYAEANILAEKEIIPLANSDFCVTVLRQATVYGLSYRMRFDLAINGMTYGVYESRELPVMRDGKQWRPFVHVKDTSDAFITVIENEDKEKVNGEIFNVGSNEQNITIYELAKKVIENTNPEAKLKWYGDPDRRSYKVDFSKIAKILNYKPRHTIEEGVKEIYNALENGEIKKTKKTITLDWYKYLLDVFNISKEVSLKDTIL